MGVSRHQVVIIKDAFVFVFVFLYYDLYLPSNLRSQVRAGQVGVSRRQVVIKDCEG